MVTEGEARPGLQAAGVGVGVGLGVGVGVGELLPTEIEIVCLKMFPAASFACTVSRCVPSAIGSDAFRVPPFWVTAAVPST